MTQMLEAATAWGRPTTWGQALVIRIHDTRNGLNPYVKAINEAMGVDVASRPTFAKLLDVDEPTQMDSKQRYLAWLLLTAMGENPQDWDVSEDDVPRGVNVRHLKKVLRSVVRHRGLGPRTRWFEVSGNTVAWPVDLAA
ncbi:MAG TPA: hypothetical protein VFH56_04425 [Acidimicrobiales bacterium]|nr:hypothetical protein [Acidimicrobiales bacterium]